MGNRAVITDINKKVGIYLHWNGGRDSVEAFLQYCKLKEYRSPENDNYGWARLCQIIGNFIGGTTSIGIDTLDNLDCNNGDNGMYIIQNWEIIGREFFDGEEQYEYDLKDMLKEIDVAQPKDEQIGDILSIEETSVAELEIGDMVYIKDYDNKYNKYTIIGIGTDKVVNGTNVLNKFYVNKYKNYGEYTNNINNYILTDTIRKYK